MHYDVNGIDRWALGFWNYRARFTNILWLKRIRKCELSHIQMGAIFLSSYFYFRIEWELPAGLVGTLARCQDWFRLVPCRQLTERLGMKEKCTLCKKKSLSPYSIRCFSMIEFVPRLSRIYHSLLSRKFLSSFPTMAVNAYQLTSTGGDLDRQLTYRELSIGKRSPPATDSLCLCGCFQRLPSLVKNFYISRKIKDFSWASCPNVTLWWKCFWLCFRLI